MSRTLPDKGLRRAAFLRYLAEGETVALASERSRLKWSTLYAWRRQEAEFREAWDKAARQGADALAARFEGALVERAVQGWDEPVFHAGEQVGTRKRYSDPLLMFGIRELRERGRPASFIASTPRVTVIIEPLKDDDELDGAPPQLEAEAKKETGDE